MTRRHDGDRISTVRRAHGPYRVDVPDLRGDVRVAARFTERDRQERRPNLLLEVRSLEVEFKIEPVSRAGEIFVQLPLGFDQDRTVIRLDDLRQTHPVRLVVLPENGGKPVPVCDELELADGRIH